MQTDSDIQNIHRQVVACIAAEDLDKAAALLRPALTRHPGDVQLNNAWGIVCLRKHAPDKAAQAFRTSLQQAPEQPAILYNLAICQQQTGQLDAALISLSQAVRLNPGFAEALGAQGFLLVRTGKLQQAIASYKAAADAAPDNPDYPSNLGGLLLATGQAEKALEIFDAVLARAPSLHEAWSNKGQALEKLGRYDKAVSAYDRAIALKPDTPRNHMHKGIALRELNRFEDSEQALNRALQLKPDDAAIWRNRGITCKAQKHYREAIRDFRQAVALDPQQPENYNLLANTLVLDLQFEEALPQYDRALELKPDFAWAYNNRANAHKELGHLKEAVADFDKAISLSRETAVFRWNKSLLELLNGHFAKGWDLFEARWERRIISTAKENLQYPRWNGEPDIKGKTILLHAEQGLGDSIQFCRYVPQVVALGAKVVLSVQPALKTVMETLPAEVTITTRGEPHGEIDLQCPLMSLPKAFATDLKSIPADVPYLHPDADKVRGWATKLGQKTRPRIGLVWSGHAGLLPDKSRSIRADILRPLLEKPFEFHCLQKEIRETDRAALAAMGPVALHDADLGDFSDTAALIENMDLVISVDTSVAHMAGAIGKPLWLLIPFAPDWRWLLKRGDSPWYPTARLFRQKTKGDWPAVIARVGKALSENF